MGIEPTSEAWEAPVLPLNYTRVGQFRILLPETMLVNCFEGYIMTGSVRSRVSTANRFNPNDENRPCRCR